jgi:predicted nucleic acid-binding protein
VIVADVNLVVYLLVEGPHTVQAESALLKDPRWAVPLLWRSEFRNVLATMRRNAGLSLSDALELAAEAEALLGGSECAVQSSTVLALASESGCSAYDCEYVALARDLSVPLVTADKQVLKAFPTIAVSIEKFAK